MKIGIKQFRKDNLRKDIVAGIVVALVSIPISMGYAQVAGLPPVYGLYGSVFPILVYCLLTSSPQFVFGVDATPAVLVGGALAGLGIIPEYPEALRVVPVITVITTLWLLIFYFIKAGKIVNYISTPVMGGFISGIGCTIILMIVPKLFGGTVGTGEFFSLLGHIVDELAHFNLLSFVLGGATVVIILTANRYAPNFPTSILMMGVGAVLTLVFPIEEYGVPLLPEVTAGLPEFMLPDMSVMATSGESIIVSSFTIALVIVAQTLLATSNVAMKNDYTIDNNREVLAYAAGNAASAFIGGCPINGSVSRTAIGEIYGCKSQVMSLSAAGTMVLVLLFGTKLLVYLPVPMLTGIVVCALIGIIEKKVAVKTWKADKREFAIFAAAFLGVLLLGTIYGVICGVILSFIQVIIRAVIPPKTFLGIIPGHEGFYNLKRNRNARPIKHTVIYRFSGNLFFANISAFQKDIEDAIKSDTRQVIVDARGIGCIDITAADRLVLIHRKLKDRGVSLYFTEHGSGVNDQLRSFGMGHLIEEGMVRRTITLALRASGVEKPYPLEGVDKAEEYPYIEANERLAEFEWAFGDTAEEQMEHLVAEIAENLEHAKKINVQTLVEAESDTSWGKVGLFDEDELLDRLEIYISELKKTGDTTLEVGEIEKRIEQRRKVVEEKINRLNPNGLEMLKRHREEIEEHIKSEHPDYYEQIMEIRKELK